MLLLLKRTPALVGNTIQCHILSGFGYYDPVCMIWTYSGFEYCCTKKSYMYRYWILFHNANRGQIQYMNATITMWDWIFLLEDTKTSPML